MAIDYTEGDLEKIDETLVKILNDANYPCTEAASALLVSMGISNLQRVGVSKRDIAALLLSLLED